MLKTKKKKNISLDSDSTIVSEGILEGGEWTRKKLPTKLVVAVQKIKNKNQS
jgi:ribonuclease HI